MRQRIRLTEGDLHRIVKASVNRILREEEEWKSPLEKARNKRNDFDKVKTIELPEKPKKKNKKPTLGDSPEFDKLKGLKFENRLNRIVRESVNRAINEGWFGNDSRYGEKWYNPFSWKSDAQKRQIRQQRTQQRIDNNLAQMQKDKARKAKESREAAEEYRKGKAERDARGGYFSDGWGSGYRQNDRTDQAGHIRAFDDDMAAYDSMGR